MVASLEEVAEQIHLAIDKPEEQASETPQPESQPESPPPEEQAKAEPEQATEPEPENEPAPEEPAPAETPEEEGTIETLSELVDYLETDSDVIMNLKTKAKVDGEEFDVTLQDLIKNYQTNSYIDKKSKDVESQRRKWESEFKETQEAFSAQMESLKTLESQLASLVAQDNEINWAELRDSDPIEYVRLKEEARERQDALAKVEAAKKLETEQQAKEQYKQYEAMVAHEQRALYQAIPEWSDESVASKEKAALRDYLASVGFQNDEIDSTIDHRAVILTRKAMMFDQLQKGKTVAKKKVKSLPKVLKPGAAQTKADVNLEKRKALQARLKKTGSIDDFANLLLEG